MQTVTEGSSALRSHSRPVATPLAEEIADHLGLSGRTIQRRLREEAGTTFQAVRDDLRERLAKSLLQETNLSVEAIAERVGFSAATNFRAAFKRWTGLTVREFRRTAG